MTNRIVFCLRKWHLLQTLQYCILADHSMLKMRQKVPKKYNETGAIYPLRFPSYMSCRNIVCWFHKQRTVSKHKNVLYLYQCSSHNIWEYSLTLNYSLNLTLNNFNYSLKSDKTAINKIMNMQTQVTGYIWNVLIVL